MKTTFCALIAAGSVIVSSPAAEVASAADDAKSAELLREHRTVETTVKSESEFRKQSAEFRRDGWSIHSTTKPRTSEDGSVVWRWEQSRPPTPDPAPVDFSREHKNVKIVENSADDLHRQFLKL